MRRSSESLCKLAQWFCLTERLLLGLISELCRASFQQIILKNEQQRRLFVFTRTDLAVCLVSGVFF